MELPQEAHYWDELEEGEKAAEWIEGKKADLLEEFAELSTSFLANIFEDEYDISFRDWLADNVHSDGVVEYFVFGWNSSYRVAMGQLIEAIDWDEQLKKYKEECEE